MILCENCLNGPFRQAEITCARGKATVLVSKKGKMTVKFKKQARMINQAALEHNRKKQYLLPEGTAVPFLVDLGVMTKEGAIVHSRYDKYRQINRFLEFIEDILPQLNKNKENVIIDFGCGKSYLTFAMYYYLKEVKGYPVRMIGLDLKEDVIRHCSDLAVRYGYEKLSFTCGDIASYEGVDHVDMVVTLHACDLATDYALEKAVGWGAKVILSVPCCQQELNRQIHNPVLQLFGIWTVAGNGWQRSLYRWHPGTDLRIQRLYTQILEFIDMERTPKMVLLRALYLRKGDSRRKERKKEAGE